jgi:hypothetical protein
MYIGANIANLADALTTYIALLRYRVLDANLILNMLNLDLNLFLAIKMLLILAYTTFIAFFAINAKHNNIKFASLASLAILAAVFAAASYNNILRLLYHAIVMR